MKTNIININLLVGVVVFEVNKVLCASPIFDVVPLILLPLFELLALDVRELLEG